jgi:hypothetical protein
MLFGNIFTGLAIVAMAIAPGVSHRATSTDVYTNICFSPVACAPTADPDVFVSEVKRTTIGDNARTCYSGIQTHCNNISTSKLKPQFSDLKLTTILLQTTTSNKTMALLVYQ